MNFWQEAAERAFNVRKGAHLIGRNWRCSQIKNPIHGVVQSLASREYSKRGCHTSKAIEYLRTRLSMLVLDRVKFAARIIAEILNFRGSHRARARSEGKCNHRIKSEKYFHSTLAWDEDASNYRRATTAAISSSS